MLSFQIKRSIENKYSHLLVALILFFILTPFFDRFNGTFPFTHLVMFLIIIFMLRILHIKRKVMLWVVFCGIMALALESLSNNTYTSKYLIALISLAYILFLGTTIILMVKNVFQEKRITGDTIKGGISIYLLLGLWWMFVYSFILMVDQNAIIDTIDKTLDLVKLYQFSFSTLTTVGYGNIVPKSEIAVTLANFEAVTGQVYLTVFIARLVGLQVSNRILLEKKMDY